MSVEITSPRYHGDVAAEHARLDFAVNIHGPTPQWLRDHLSSRLDSCLAAYPTAAAERRAVRAVADMHGIDGASVCLVAGASEAFSLLAGMGCAAADLVHPSFTEPDVVLTATGCDIRRIVLGGDFGLDDVVAVDGRPAAGGVIDHVRPGSVVVVGNPTNPTAVVHRGDDVAALVGDNRTVVVDEAFMDVCGDRQSLVARAATTPGLVVVRSLTKTWALAGLRVGYVVAEPGFIARLTTTRRHWPLASLQLAAITAVADNAATYLPAIQHTLATRRAAMVRALAAAGFTVSGPERPAPFVLVRPPGDADMLYRLLAADGIAVRSCASFPGLDGSFWRLAVRDAASVAELVDAVQRAGETIGRGAPGRGR
ncbi:threonine-phosphate decarboxylase [Corynebacterium sp. CCM 8862]|uniref:Aminotransferase n=1 Tax=Corynebacterium mendelii TaxID=2765362 RepID=A0A939DY72_9CORY|nr:Rv2231c family pyridoxal phosphate-dependent protein CobC [Corynebacterium mendelii]MBN9643031.1 threonine-phosphate decarboxylase [Corynebacterium mendelii]